MRRASTTKVLAGASLASKPPSEAGGTYHANTLRPTSATFAGFIAPLERAKRRCMPKSDPVLASSDESFSEELVARLAKMAQLHLSVEELAHYRTTLAPFINHLRQLETLPLGEVASQPSSEGPPTPLRPDESAPPLPTELALANAPRHDGASFRVPKVL